MKARGRRERLLSAVSLAAGVAAWEAAARAGLVNRLVFPPPTRVFAELLARTASGELPGHAWTTAATVAAGLAAGAAAGLPLGLAAARWRWLSALLDPWAQALVAVPKVALIPVAFMTVGTGDAMRVALVATDVAVTFYIAALAAARRVPPGLLEAAANLGARPLQAALEVRLPAMAPTLLVAAQLALLQALRLAIALEMLFSMRGFGHQLWTTGEAFAADAYYAYVLALCAVALALSWALRRLQTGLKGLDELARV